MCANSRMPNFSRIAPAENGAGQKFAGGFPVGETVRAKNARRIFSRRLPGQPGQAVPWVGKPEAKKIRPAFPLGRLFRGLA